jgi:hypothetical protein
LAKLKLLLDRKLVHSLANLRLLAEVKVDLPLLRLGFLFEEMESSEGLRLLVELMDSSLVKLVLLFEKEVIGSLMKIKSPLEQRMVQLLVNLHAEGESFQQGGSPIFLLQVPD